MDARRKLVGSHLLCAASDGHTRTVLGSFLLRKPVWCFLREQLFAVTVRAVASHSSIDSFIILLIMLEWLSEGRGYKLEMSEL